MEKINRNHNTNPSDTTDTQSRERFDAPEQIASEIFSLTSELRESRENTEELTHYRHEEINSRLTRLLEAQLARNTDRETAMEFGIRPFSGANDLKIGSSYGKTAPHELESIIQAYDALDREIPAAQVVLTQIAVLQPRQYPSLLNALADERTKPGNLRNVVHTYMQQADDNELIGMPANKWYWERNKRTDDRSYTPGDMVDTPTTLIETDTPTDSMYVDTAQVPRAKNHR